MQKPRLIPDYDHGEGSIKWPPNWLALDPLLRADILGDWLHEIAGAYDKAVADLHAEFKCTKQ